MFAPPALFAVIIVKVRIREMAMAIRDRGAAALRAADQTDRVVLHAQTRTQQRNRNAQTDRKRVVAGEAVARAVEEARIGLAGQNRTDKTIEGRDVEEERVVNQSGEECDAGVLIGRDHGLRRGRVQSRNGGLSGEAREEGRFDGRGLWRRADVTFSENVT